LVNEATTQVQVERKTQGYRSTRHLLRSLRLFATVEDQGRVGAVSTGDDDKGNFARAGSGFSPRALASPKHPNCFAREYPEKSKNHNQLPHWYSRWPRYF
jgi:hypothetical protein